MRGGFRYVDGRDMWERQTGETAEAFDWFSHWLAEGHRRSFVRSAEKWQVSRDRVAGVARRNKWTERLAAYKADQSKQIRERFEDLAEQALVPFTQAAARLAAHAASTDLTGVSADKALTASANAFRVLKEPSVRDFIRLADANAAAAREFAPADFILDRLADQYPDAYDAMLDALNRIAAGEDPDLPADDPDDDGADAGDADGRSAAG